MGYELPGRPCGRFGGHLELKIIPFKHK